MISINRNIRTIVPNINNPSITNTSITSSSSVFTPTTGVVYTAEAPQTGAAESKMVLKTRYETILQDLETKIEELVKEFEQNCTKRFAGSSCIPITGLKDDKIETIYVSITYAYSGKPEEKADAIAAYRAQLEKAFGIAELKTKITELENDINIPPPTTTPNCGITTTSEISLPRYVATYDPTAS